MGIEEKLQILQDEVFVLKNRCNKLDEQLTKRQEEKQLTVKQVAKILGLTPNGVNYHIRQGSIKATGKRNKKITEAEVIRYKKENNY